MKPRIDPHRWTEVRAAFDALVELDGASRRERLATLEASDPDLRRQVEALLFADAELTTRLDHLDDIFASDANRDVEQELDADPLKLAGRVVSHFKIGEPLAAGGRASFTGQ